MASCDKHRRSMTPSAQRMRLVAAAAAAGLLMLLTAWASGGWRQQSSGPGDVSWLAALQRSLKNPKTRIPQGLPYLFDASLEPGVNDACGHCAVKDPKKVDIGLLPGAGVEEPAEGAGPFCCGVCQFEGRYCREMAPAGAVQHMVDMYRRDFGFDFHGFQPAELFSRIRGRTLWFIGDSQTWHSYYAAECFLRTYALDLVRRPATNSSQEEMPLRPVTWPVIVASMCIHLREDTRICNVRINIAKEVGAVLRALIESQPPERFPQDVAVVNFGLHYQPDKRLRDDVELFHREWMEDKAKLPTIIWRDVPVQHFATPKGEFDPASLGKHCQPLQRFYDGDPATVSGGPYNNVIADAVRNLSADGVHVLHTWNASVPLWDMHKTGECTHWCSPSAYHVWLFLLNKLMRERQLGNAVD